MRRNSERPPVRQRLRRGAYLLPSLFTIGNVLLGFYAVILATDGQIQRAAVMIFIAGVLDSLDGRIARLMHTESEFGKEFDSLADVLTFGMAPALVAWHWGLSEHGRIGWLVPIFYLLCTTIRLARFNVQTKSVDSRYFVGMPSPPAACSVGACFFFSPRPDFWSAYVDPLVVEVALFAVLALMGTLMVSTFRYPSGKKVDLKKRWSYRAGVPLAAVLVLLVWILDNYPTAFFLTVAVVYTSTGPLAWLVGRLFRRRGPRTPAEEAETPVEGSP